MKVRNLKKSYLLIAAAFMVSFAGITAVAAQTENGRRASNIQSKGNFDYENGKVVICSSDLTYLADEIDLLEDTYKTETVRALDQIGTYFRTDGTPTHSESDNNIPSSEARQLPYNVIMEGIVRSQSIPTERTYTGILPGQTAETHGNIFAAIENNLTLGAAAWVDGKLIVGNGADNDSYYTKGKKDGYDDGYLQGNKDGYDNGYAQGSKDGYDNGYAQGNKDGHDNGYNQGYEAGAAASKVHIIQVTDGDIKSLLPDVYQSLTADNFFTKLESVSGLAASDGMGSKSTYYGIQCHMTYDASTGWLTVDGEFSGSNVSEDGRHSAGYTGYSVKDYVYAESGSGSVRGETNVKFSLWCVY